MRDWVNEAIRKIEADFKRSSDTHLLKVDLPFIKNVEFYLKDESTHPTGSLKHRLARSLFLYGLCNGKIHETTTIIEASSGSTAISEAYFAKLIGLRFIAVVPQNTSSEKIKQITFYGGECHMVDAKDVYGEASRLALELNGYYMDQFTLAERATDWRGNNNIAESIFNQMSMEPSAIPKWIVVSAGTGGTSATIGRYIRLKHHDTQLCVADPENSVFFDFYQSGDANLTLDCSSRIEGIGRPRVEPSFFPTLIDKIAKVPDAASIATIHFLEKILGRKVGGSTGTNVYASFQIISHLNCTSEPCSVVSMICDNGERYLDTYYNQDWIDQQGLDTHKYRMQLDRFFQTGAFQSVE